MLREILCRGRRRRIIVTDEVQWESTKYGLVWTLLLETEGNYDEMFSDLSVCSVKLRQM